MNSIDIKKHIHDKDISIHCDGENQIKTTLNYFKSEEEIIPIRGIVNIEWIDPIVGWAWLFIETPNKYLVSFDIFNDFIKQEKRKNILKKFINLNDKIR